MLIQVRAPRLKPAGGPVLRVRRDHALAAELRACVVFGGAAGVGVDLVGGVVLTAGGAPGFDITADGPGLHTNTSQYATMPHEASLNVTGAISLAWRGMHTIVGEDILFHKLNSGGSGGGEYTPWDVQIRATGEIYFVRSRSGAFNFRAWQGSVVAPQTQMMSVVITQGAAIEVAPRFFIDGVEDATITNMFGGVATGEAFGNTDPVQFNGYAGGSYGNILHSVFLLAGRQWDDSENAGFHTDPYGILEDAPLYHFMVGGPTGTTVSLTGISLTSSAGSVEEGIAVAAAGSAATSAAGTLTSALAASLSGSAGTGALGTVAPGIGMTLTGAALTVSAGSLAYTIGFTLTGISSATAGGTISSSGGDTETERALTGISMSALPGNVRVTGGTRWVPQEARAATVATSAGNTMPPPPRLTGDAQTDIRAQQQYLQTFYDQFVKVNNVLGRINDHETRIAALEGDT